MRNWVHLKRTYYFSLVLCSVCLGGLHCQVPIPASTANASSTPTSPYPLSTHLWSTRPRDGQHAKQQAGVAAEEIEAQQVLHEAQLHVWHSQRVNGGKGQEEGEFHAELEGSGSRELENVGEEVCRFSGVYRSEEGGPQCRRAVLQKAVEAPAWRGRFDATYKLSYFAPHLVFDSRYANRPWLKIVTDPTDPASRQPVIRVVYKKGGWSGRRGGTLFYASPFGRNVPIARQGARLEYDVYFPPKFDFVKGGKLPGLASGRGCGGGVSADSCWSVRVMWRREGEGEAYLYVPRDVQHPSLCRQPPYTKCDPDSGISLSRGAFRFIPGAWHRLGVTVLLNRRPNTRTGSVVVTLDGKQVIAYHRLNYRKRRGINVQSIYFASWFGGGDSSWAPSRGTFLLFKNLRLYQLDPKPPAVATAAVGGLPSVSPGGTPQEQSPRPLVDVEDTGEPWDDS